MKICGIELKANNTIITVVDINDNHINFMDIKEKKLTIEDDENIEELINYSNHLKNIIKKYDIDTIAIKKRAKKGNFSGGAVTFKLEGIIQLNGICDVKLFAPQTISKFENKNDIELPINIKKYQEQAYLTALCCSDTI
jgi:hypothetical protein